MSNAITTTEILFNSPALKSLKRDQLVKLCKIHSIKASGKTPELIHRLKQHAQNLPKDAPLSIAARSEKPDDESMKDSDFGVESMPGSFMDVDADESGIHAPAESTEQNGAGNEEGNADIEGASFSTSSSGRLSEQWTIMEALDEDREFGNGSTSTKVNSVGSSIKAFATSLGLKRANNSSSNAPATPSSSLASSKRTLFTFSTPNPKSSGSSATVAAPAQTQTQKPDDLTQTAVPYHSLPPPTNPPLTDNLSFTPPRLDRQSAMTEAAVDPIPGSALRPGVSAPSGARLSLGLGLSGEDPSTSATTLRLIKAGTMPDASEDIAAVVKSSRRGETRNSSGDNEAQKASTEERLYPELPSPYEAKLPYLASIRSGDTDSLMDVDPYGGIALDEDDNDVGADDVALPGSYTPSKKSPSKSSKSSKSSGMSLLKKTFGNAKFGASVSSLASASTLASTPSKTGVAGPSVIANDGASTSAPLAADGDDKENERVTATATTTNQATSITLNTPTKSTSTSTPTSTTTSTLAPTSASTPLPSQSQPSSGLKPSPREPFVFGSPLPQHKVSNDEFKDVAASVLAEMNARLAKDGIAPVNVNVLQGVKPGQGGVAALGSVEASGSGVPVSQEEKAKRMVMGLPGSAIDNGKDRFEKAHEEEFSKMESILDVYKRRARVVVDDEEREEEKEKKGGVEVGKKRKSTVVEQEDAVYDAALKGRGKSKKAQVGAGAKVQTQSQMQAQGSSKGAMTTRAKTRVVSASRRTVPGAFGDDDEGEEGDNRGGKRVRIDAQTKEVDRHGDSDNTMGHNENATENEEGNANEVDEEPEERRRGAIKKKLEVNKAKRRSSLAAARGTRTAGASASEKQPPDASAKPKQGRFAFLSSAKTLVSNVLSRGKGKASGEPQGSATPNPPAVSSSTNDPSTSDTGAEAETGGDMHMEAHSGETAPEAPARPEEANATVQDSEQGDANPSHPPQAEGRENGKKAATLPRSSKPPITRSGTGTTRSVGSRLPSTSSIKSTARARPPIPSSLTSIPTKSAASALPRALSPPTTTAAAGVRAATTRSTMVPSLGQRSTIPTAKKAQLPAAGASSLGVAKKKVESTAAAAATTTTAVTTSRIPSISKASATSRLMRPTASSLARATSPPMASQTGSSLPRLKAKVVPKSMGITITTAIAAGNGGKAGENPKSPGALSPGATSSRPGGIFSRQLEVPKAGAGASGNYAATNDDGDAQMDGQPGERAKALGARNSRISKPKVVAKLASQREAGAAGSSGSANGVKKVAASPAKTPVGKVRSSMGVRARSGAGEGKSDKGVDEDVLRSAKKRVMQNEYYARRSSRLASAAGTPGQSPVKGGAVGARAEDEYEGSEDMEVDA